MTDLEIREQIAHYIRGDVDARALEDRLETGTWEADIDDPAATLVGDALRLLAEFANGDWTDSELREQLGALSRTYWFEQAPRLVITGSDATVMRQDHPSVALGTQRVMASV